MEGRMGTMGDEPIERPEREEARSGEAERAVKEVGSAKSARDADAAGKEGAEPYKPGSFEGGIVEFPSGDEPAVPPRKRLPLVLAIIGLVLCFTGSLALVGAACGAVSLGLFVRDRKATEGSPVLAAPKATLGLAACSLLLGITIMAGMASGDDAQVQQPDQPASQQQEALLEAAEEHELSFVVEAAGEEDVPASVTVLVTGTQADGTKVSDSHRAALGKTYVLAYPAGSYTFEVSASSLEAGDVLFKAERVECTFDGSADRTVRIKARGPRKRRLPKRLPPPRPPKSRLLPPQPSRRPLPQPRQPRRAARAIAAATPCTSRTRARSTTATVAPL